MVEETWSLHSWPRQVEEAAGLGGGGGGGPACRPGRPSWSDPGLHALRLLEGLALPPSVRPGCWAGGLSRCGRGQHGSLSWGSGAGPGRGPCRRWRRWREREQESMNGGAQCKIKGRSEALEMAKQVKPGGAPVLRRHGALRGSPSVPVYSVSVVWPQLFVQSHHVPLLAAVPCLADFLHLPLQGSIHTAALFLTSRQRNCGGTFSGTTNVGTDYQKHDKGRKDTY